MNHKLSDDRQENAPQLYADTASVLDKCIALLRVRSVASLIVAAAAGYLIGRLQDDPD